MLAWSPPPSAPDAAVVPARSPASHDRTVRLPRISSTFGPRVHPIRGGTALHGGIDIPRASGTPIRASADGVIAAAGSSGGYGLMIDLDHGAGLVTRYAHLSRLLVKRGTPVRRGEVIALMGSSGRSTGSHLHYEVRLRGRAVDPLPYLRRANDAGPGRVGAGVSASAKAVDALPL